jgi:hypothetical protein
MSFLKSALTIQATTWLEKLLDELPTARVYLDAYMHNKRVLPTPETAWDWLRVCVLHDMPRQTQVVHACIRAQAPADELWRALATGRTITMFDMPDMLVGGMNDSTRRVFRVLSRAYEIIFGRKDVLPFEDDLDELCRQQAWVTVSCLAHAHVYGPTGELRPLMHYAVLVRRLDVLRALLRALDVWGDAIVRGEVVNMRGLNGETLMHLVCAQEDPMWTKILLTAGADPFARDAEGRTAFHVNPTHGKLEILKRAVRYPTREWFDVLHDLVVLAARRGDAPLLQAVLDAGGDPNAPGSFDAALEADSATCITLLAGYGGDPNAVLKKHTPSLDALRAWVNVGGRPVARSRLLVRKLFGREDMGRVLFINALYDFDAEDAAFFARQGDVADLVDFLKHAVPCCDETARMQDIVRHL